ncbi:MAG: hypothetical protein K9H84_00440 [Bacteroidales bacterium]|nr:hypothetical protein [Bacteroidales bacterium]
MFLAGLCLFICNSCNNVENKARQTINKSGEAVGKSSAEFFEGVTEGVDKILQPEITLSEDLKVKGLEFGKCIVERDSGSHNKNKFVLYLIFNENIRDTLLLKAYDKNGMEIGRTIQKIDKKAGQAKYFDFIFDERTNIEVKSKIKIE